MNRIVLQPTLALFAKRSRRGTVKTRLIPALGEVGATDLYQAMLEDGIDRLRRFVDRSWSTEIWWKGEPESGNERQPGYPQICHYTQEGPDLGQRMAGAIRHALRRGHSAGVILGVDAPTLPDRLIIQLSQGLAKPRSIGVIPATDGGYVTLGASADPLPLFGGIAWGGPQVLAATRRKARMLDWHWFETEPWYDVDRVEDLTRLRTDCSDERCDLARHTSCWLAAHRPAG